MSEFTIPFTTVVWTTGDTITEAKLDNMVANDQAYDAHEGQGFQLARRSGDPSTPANNKLRLYAKDYIGKTSLFFMDETGDVYRLNDEEKWRPAKLTFTHNSDFSLTINGIDVREMFPPGTKIRLTQNTGGIKYFVVYTNEFVTNTTLNFIPTTNYKLENEAIANPLYSYDTPPDWPHWFNFNPQFSVAGGTVPTFTAIAVNRWMVVGRRIDVELNNVNVTGGIAGAGVQEIRSVPPVPIPDTVYNNAQTRGFLGMVYSSGIGFGMVRARLSDTSISFTSADGTTAALGNSFTADQRFISSKYSFGF